VPVHVSGKIVVEPGSSVPLQGVRNDTSRIIDVDGKGPACIGRYFGKHARRGFFEYLDLAVAVDPDFIKAAEGQVNQAAGIAGGVQGKPAQPDMQGAIDPCGGQSRRCQGCRSERPSGCSYADGQLFITGRKL